MNAVERIRQLRDDIALFPKDLDNTLAVLCYANSRSGEKRGFTYGDLRALCDLADHAAALIESGVPDDDGDAIAIRNALARLSDD